MSIGCRFEIGTRVVPLSFFRNLISILLTLVVGRSPDPTTQSTDARSILSAVLAFLAILQVLLPSASAAERPNVVLMMADDLGFGDVGFNGNRVIRTPNLDAMANAGIKFNRFYAAAPVCSPTRGSCLTGRHPFRYGVLYANVGHMKQPEVTLAEVLHDQGYSTGHFGKWHLGTLTTSVKDSNRGGPRGARHFAPPQAHGFDTCFSTEAKVPTFDPLFRPADGSGKWWDPIATDAARTPYGTRYWNERGEAVTNNLDGDDSRVIMDRVIPFIESAARRGDPFLAVVWFHAPHRPVVAGREDQMPYRAYDGFERNYYGCITALDRQVGRLRSKLRELGVEQNTLVWFCSDNGPEGAAADSPGSAGPLRGRKRSLYEGGIRVPGVLEWPSRITQSRTTDVPAVTSDILPTVLEIVGARSPDDRPLDGVSLVPLIDGQMAARPRPIGFASRGQISWVDDQYKIISADGGNTWELYDLPADVGEQSDVAHKHENIVDRMAQEARAWLDSCRRSAAEHDYADNDGVEIRR